MVFLLKKSQPRSLIIMGGQPFKNQFTCHTSLTCVRSINFAYNFEFILINIIVSNFLMCYSNRQKKVFLIYLNYSYPKLYFITMLKNIFSRITKYISIFVSSTTSSNRSSMICTCSIKTSNYFIIMQILIKHIRNL